MTPVFFFSMCLELSEAAMQLMPVGIYRPSVSNSPGLPMEVWHSPRHRILVVRDHVEAGWLVQIEGISKSCTYSSPFSFLVSKESNTEDLSSYYILVYAWEWPFLTEHIEHNHGCESISAVYWFDHSEELIQPLWFPIYKPIVTKYHSF